MIYLLGFGIFTLALAVYIALIAWAAKRDIDSAPRIPMFMCDVHGPLPESSLLTLFDSMEYQDPVGKTVRGPIRSCPLCYQMKIKQARAKYG